MKDYQRIKGNKYILPNAVYMQTIWILRDYPRMRQEADAILHESPPPPDGQPRGTGKGDDVFTKAARREDLLRKTSAIENALGSIPKEYRQGVWRNVIER